ncbi:MAG: Mut7-C RNAse domain-containing protein [Syntrophobacteraceae bacterium]
MCGASAPAKRFALDIMLGKLARWLRVLGLDARSILLANRGVLESLLSAGVVPVTRREKFRHIEGVIFIRADHHFEQLAELISLCTIQRDQVRLFSRCALCNAPLEPAAPREAFGAVPDYIFETTRDFRKCPQCGRIYWPGSHRQKMAAQLEAVTGWNLREEKT